MNLFPKLYSIFYNEFFLNHFFYGNPQNKFLNIVGQVFVYFHWNKDIVTVHFFGDESFQSCVQSEINSTFFVSRNPLLDSLLFYQFFACSEDKTIIPLLIFNVNSSSLFAFIFPWTVNLISLQFAFVVLRFCYAHIAHYIFKKWKI